MWAKVSNDFSTPTKKDSCRSSSCGSACLCCVSANRHSVLSSRGSPTRPTTGLHSCAWQRASQHSWLACVVPLKRLVSLSASESYGSWSKTFWWEKIPSPFVTAFRSIRVRLKTAAPNCPKAKITFCVRGVISPLLANLYLHWFDAVFHGAEGRAQWEGAKLVRYAEDFVVLARYQGRPLKDWIETKLENRFGLEINRDKTRVVQLKEEGASLNFLGFTFRHYRDLYGRERKYLNVSPSEAALKRERAKLHAMTDRHQCFKPLPTLISELNRHLKGWQNYFRFGYPRQAFREINSYVRSRLTQHVKRRSQRPFRPPKGTTYYHHFQKMGLMEL